LRGREGLLGQPFPFHAALYKGALCSGFLGLSAPKGASGRLSSGILGGVPRSQGGPGLQATLAADKPRGRPRAGCAHLRKGPGPRAQGRVLLVPPTALGPWPSAFIPLFPLFPLFPVLTVIPVIPGYSRAHGPGPMAQRLSPIFSLRHAPGPAAVSLARAHAREGSLAGRGTSSRDMPG